MVDTTLEIYKQVVPFGLPKVQKDVWNSGSKPEIKVEPDDGYILFVKAISFKMTDDFELSVGSMRMQHSLADGSNAYLQLDITDSDELLAMCESLSSLEKPASSVHLVGAFSFHPPIRCRSSATPTEYFTVIEEGSLTVAGDIFITVHAWQMLETDFDET